MDFTLSDIKKLRAIQGKSFRDPNYNGLFEIPTFEEQVSLGTLPSATTPSSLLPPTIEPSTHPSHSSTVVEQNDVARI